MKMRLSKLTEVDCTMHIDIIFSPDFEADETTNHLRWTERSMCAVLIILMRLSFVLGHILQQLRLLLLESAVNTQMGSRSTK